jgi:hypothetical protein
MRTWGKPPYIGEVEILSDEESLRFLRRVPNFRVRLSGMRLLRDGIDVVAELGQRLDEADRQVLV